jgi:serine/threonine protein phosphatase PrpC
VTSLINKIFHKKTSGEIPSSDQHLHLDDPRKVTNNPDAALEEKIAVNVPVKTHLDMPQLIVGVAQSVGIQRDHNEDALFTLTTNLVSGEKSLYFGLYIIADGMGGHENGEIASSVAVDRLTSHVIHSLYLPLFSPLSNKLELSIQEIMQTGVIQAHQAIKKEALGSGTTLTSALILGDQMTIAHVGDSRAYMMDPDANLQLLTHDHSLVKRLEEIGQISPEQVSTHPQRNVLYRALGQGEPFEPDIATYQLQQGSQILLCTDGLWGVISDSDMEHVIRSIAEPQQACQSLTHLANLAGGPDNISVILVRMPE